MNIKGLTSIALAAVFTLGTAFASEGDKKGESKKATKSEMNIKVYDSKGTVVLKDDLKDDELKFDLSEMPTGIYQVEVASGNTVVNETNVMHRAATNNIYTRVISENDEVVLYQTHEAGSNESLDFDLADLAEGTYTLEVYVGNKVVSRQMMKN